MNKIDEKKVVSRMHINNGQKLFGSVTFLNRVSGPAMRVSSNLKMTYHEFFLLKQTNGTQGPPC